MAKEKARFYSAKAQREDIRLPARARASQNSPAARVAMDRWVGVWLADRERRGIGEDAEKHWRCHGMAVLGGQHISEWTASDLRTFVVYLDDLVINGKRTPKTVANIWGSITKMFDDAQSSKVEALRCREDNPSAHVRGPDGGAKRKKQVLYPSEALMHLECAAIPLRYRRYVAISIYTGLRAGELRVLRWADVDLEHGLIHVHRAWDNKRKCEKPTKGMQNRRVPIEPALRPLLEVMHAEAGENVFVAAKLASECELAPALRRHLRLAGVDRDDLFARRATSLHITWHALRGTNATWCAVRGDDPIRIQVRLGHRNFSTTQGYIGLAEVLKAGFRQPFPELPECLIGDRIDHGIDQRAVSARYHASPAGFEPALQA